MYTHTYCPVCKNKSFNKFITCIDYTVSREKFDIVTCASCDFKFTNPIPDVSQLGRYYKSEDYISHSNTKKGIISKIYHLVRRYTLKKKLALVSKYVSRGTILDYGCGTGMFLQTCTKGGWNALGIEPDAGARKIALMMDLKILKNNREIIEKQKEFDAITLWHVLEHIPDVNETITFLYNALKPDGVIIVAVPNHTSYDAQYYGQFWAAYDVPRHLYHFEKKTIEHLFSTFDFKLIGAKGMKFDSFYVSMLSEKYKNGSIGYFKAFVSGLKSNLKAMSSNNYSSVIYVFKKK